VKYVLDTSTVSELMKGEPEVVRRLTQHDRNDVLLPQPVVSEIAYGLQRMKRSARRSRLESRFGVVLDEMPRAPWTDDVSQAFGRIKSELERSGTPLEDFDVAIAAHAIAMDATLVTGDTKHMKRVRGLRSESWIGPRT
jgi:tRNA(fMet)-specific endonuclease VapC